LFKVSTQGRELVIKVLNKGARFNEVPVFNQQLNPVSVVAISASVIWTIVPEVIRQYIAQYPEMAQSVIHNLCTKLGMLLGTVEELSFYQVTNRLARLISQLPGTQLQGDRGQRLTQDALVARLGTVRDVVARSLRELKRSGAILFNRGQIHVTDEDRLKEWTQNTRN